ncbi:MAG: redox-regulated ATPase YchF [Parcubacteria group bacterium]|jgi:hypothetical protein
MKIGIVGLPNVGKSTLFKALTKTQVDISNYPFCTIEPNVGIVKVPDERLEKLAAMSHSAKIIPAIVEFVDIAGIVKGASVGEGLGNKFLANIREVDAIAQVVRVFENTNITHVHNKIDPEHDIEIINTELILADLETVQKVKVRLEKDARGNKKGATEQLVVTEKIKTALEAGNLANTVKLDLEDENTKTIVRELSLLTMKPFLFIYNVADTKEKLPDNLEKLPHIKLDIKIEEELLEMSPEEAAELGIESSIDQLIIEAYKLLGLITFLTTGEDETRAWTIQKGWTAPLAGTAIHNDFKDKFIRAEVIQWNKLLEAGSWGKARELGTLRTEGKDYIVQDGDVIEFKI